MNSPKQQVGAPGYTDEVDKRLDRIAELLVTQQTKPRSTRMLLSLFQAFFRVCKERTDYVAQVHNQTQSLAWANGYLHATADAINGYLERRFSLPALTFEECELIVERRSLSKLLEYGPEATGTGPTSAYSRVDAGDRAASSIGIRPLGNVLLPATDTFE